MRDPERLDLFYEKLKEIHKHYFLDWRYGQLYVNFLRWLNAHKGIDGFYLEEDKMLAYIEEFAKNSTSGFEC